VVRPANKNNITYIIMPMIMGWEKNGF
jgi:hypothetical protein